MTLTWYQSHLAGTSASRLVGDDLDAYCSKADRRRPDDTCGGAPG